MKNLDALTLDGAQNTSANIKCANAASDTHATVHESSLIDPNKSTTELVFILDRSGSMSGLEKDTIGGFNSTVAKQKEEPGRAFVTTVLFDHKVETLYERKPLETVGKLTRRQYYVRGCTALLDAVGQTIKRVNKMQKASIAGRPTHTIFVITTDGMENASKLFTADEVRKLIEKRKEKNGWEFVFLGANIDAVETARTIGISEDYAADFDASPMGLEDMYEAVGAAVCSIRSANALDKSWKQKLTRK